MRGLHGSNAHARSPFRRPYSVESRRLSRRARQRIIILTVFLALPSLGANFRNLHV